MALNNALRRGQADTCPFEILLTMKALEDSKELIGMFEVEAHSIVTDEQGGDAVGFAGAHLNHSGLTRACKLDSVGKEIRKDQSEEAWVAVHLWQGLGVPFDFSLGCLRRQVGDGLPNHLVKFYSLAVELLAPEAGKIEEIVHQISHVICSGQDALQVTASRFREFI
jgi:hypothetical protein